MNTPDFILAIDPGNVESGYVLTNAHTLKPIEFGKVNNFDLLDNIHETLYSSKDKTFDVAIEMLASYGMPVGKDVLETAVWIGRFWQAIADCEKVKKHTVRRMKLIFRADEKINICHSMKANDTTIRQALVDRFASGEPNFGKGTKKDPGFFYGFKADVWSAFAVAVTYYDMYLAEEFMYADSNEKGGFYA